MFLFFFNFDLRGGQATRRSPYFGSTPGYIHTHERIKSDLIGALQEFKRAKKRILQREAVTMRTEFVLLKMGSLSINWKCRVFSLWEERIFNHYLD